MSTDLNLVVALRALLEEANVTRAGDRLGVSQSMMSASLARLRRHYRDELLIRVGRDYELTPLGRVLLPGVRRAVPMIEDALGQNPEFDPVTQRHTFTVLLSDFAVMELKNMFVAIAAVAEGVRFDFRPLPDEASQYERALKAGNLVITGRNSVLPGASRVLFVDHYVCVVDRHNPRVVGGTLTWEDFTSMSHARASFGRDHHPPAHRRMVELGFTTPPKVVTRGLLPLPGVVAGTDMVAVVPSRLAARLCPVTGTRAVPTPFERVELIETLWWNEDQLGSRPAHRWFLDEFAHAAVARTGPAGLKTANC